MILLLKSVVFIGVWILLQKKGVPVYATGNGVVKRADNRSSGYGNHIRIDHGFGYVSLYAHLSKYNVRRGQKVKRGDLIGYVGNTGRSAGPHLHYEIFKDKKTYQSIEFLLRKSISKRI